MIVARRIWFARARLLLVAAAAFLALAASPIDWVRQGNAAFERGDFAEAIRNYERAEALTRDPGLVAYNMAAAHYELQHFAAAELCYRRALEDADGVRRVRALYGLGNALAQQGNEFRGRVALERLTAALNAFDACLAEGASRHTIVYAECQDTFLDARFNYQLVEQLLERKRAEAQVEPPPPDDGPRTGPPNDRTPDKNSRPGDSKNGSAKKGATDRKNPEQTGPPDVEKPQPGDPPPLGKGNLPLLLDDRDAPALDGSSARAHLQAALERIRKDRAQHTTAPAGASARVRDW